MFLAVQAYLEYIKEVGFETPEVIEPQNEAFIDALQKSAYLFGQDIVDGLEAIKDHSLNIFER